MDCNSSKALRLKGIAERKFHEEDYVGAKEVARSALGICPGLSTISLFITIVDIYCSRKREINGQPDWYGVIGVKPSDDLALIYKSFRKLYLDLDRCSHKVAGVEGALKILTEAWSILKQVSDTFWSKCTGCRFRFQYSTRVVLSQLICQNCGKHFLAVPTFVENDHKKSILWSSYNTRHVVLGLPASGGVNVDAAPMKKVEAKEKVRVRQASEVGSQNCGKHLLAEPTFVENDAKKFMPQSCNSKKRDVVLGLPASCGVNADTPKKKVEAKVRQASEIASTSSGCVNGMSGSRKRGQPRKVKDECVMKQSKRTKKVKGESAKPEKEVSGPKQKRVPTLSRLETVLLIKKSLSEISKHLNQ